jgi:hypothetical protein
MPDGPKLNVAGLKVWGLKGAVDLPKLSQFTHTLNQRYQQLPTPLKKVVNTAGWIANLTVPKDGFSRATNRNNIIAATLPARVLSWAGLHHLTTTLSTTGHMPLASLATIGLFIAGLDSVAFCNARQWWQKFQRAKLK